MTAMFQGQPILGSPGKDATINGVNTLELVAGENVVLNQNENSMSISSLNSYSTEETRIGTWIDGKPIYRRCFYTKTSNNKSTWVTVPNSHIENLGDIINMYGTCMNIYGAIFPIAQWDSYAFCAILYNRDKLNPQQPDDLQIFVNVNEYLNCPCSIILEYTKTTDIATINFTNETNLLTSTEHISKAPTLMDSTATTSTFTVEAAPTLMDSTATSSAFTVTAAPTVVETFSTATSYGGE